MFQKNEFLEARLEFIYMALFGMTEKENSLDRFSLKHKCKRSLIWFQSDSTTSICFGEKSNLSSTSRLLQSYFIIKKKSECNKKTI